MVSEELWDSVSHFAPAESSAQALLAWPVVSKAFLKYLTGGQRFLPSDWGGGGRGMGGWGGDPPGKLAQSVDLSGWLPSVRCQESSGISKKFI